MAPLETSLLLASIAALPLALLWSLPLLAEATALLSYRRRPKAGPPDRPPRLLVLVPAHDEAQLIAECARSLVGMTSSTCRYRTVVIADNCTDDTAGMARSAGVEVLERSDAERRGKPWAIHWALEQLADDLFDAVVIVDADTTVEPGFADALAGHRDLREKAVQGYFGLSNPDESWLTTLGQVLNLARYEWSFPLKAGAGRSVPLTGNAMCLGREFLGRVGWPVESLTENWEIYARAVAAGEVVEFEPRARIASQEARDLSEGATQRKRWLAGRWRVLRDHWRGILVAPTSLGERLDAVAELFSPGPVLHGALGVLLGFGLLLVDHPAAHVAGWAFLLSLLPSIWWTIVGIAKHRSPVRAAIACLMLPPYAVWRVVVAFLTWARGASRTWVRSPRHTPSSSSHGLPR